MQKHLAFCATLELWHGERSIRMNDNPLGVLNGTSALTSTGGIATFADGTQFPVLTLTLGTTLGVGFPTTNCPTRKAGQTFTVSGTSYAPFNVQRFKLEKDRSE